MKIKSLIFLFFVLLIFQSCNKLNKGFVNNSSSQTLSQREYVSWMQEPKNGFCIAKEMDDLSYNLQFRTYDYIICIENKGTPVADSLKRQRYEELKGMDYFEFTIKLINGGGELLKYKLTSNSDYSSRVQYFAFDMQKDFQVKYGDSDPLPCVLYHFERTYDIAPYAKFIIGFERPKGNDFQDIVVEYNDRVFDKGLMKFIFNKESFNKIPKLQTDR